MGLLLYGGLGLLPLWGLIAYAVLAFSHDNYQAVAFAAAFFSLASIVLIQNLRTKNMHVTTKQIQESIQRRDV